MSPAPGRIERASSAQLDDLLDPMDAALDLIEDILDRLDRLRLEPDVPLDQRGFGVMEEPPHQPSPGPDRRY